MPTIEERLERAEAALTAVIQHAKRLQNTVVGSYDEYHAAIVDAGNHLEEVVEELGYEIPDPQHYENRIITTTVIDAIDGHEHEYVRVFDKEGAQIARGYVQGGPVVPFHVRPDGLCVAEPFVPGPEHTIEVCELKPYW